MPEPASAASRFRQPPLAWQIAWRFLRGRRSEALTSTGRAALAATTLGVTSMVIAMALMTGYRQDLQRKLIGGNAAILAYPLGPAEALTPAMEERLRAVPGIDSVALVAYAQGSLVSAARPQGAAVTLRGVDRTGGSMAPVAGGLEVDSDGIGAVTLGEELATSLDTRTGDLLRLVALGFRAGRPRFTYRSLRVAGTFRSGLSEFDESWAVTGRRQVEELLGGEGATGLIEFAVADPGETGATVDAIRAVLGEGYLITDWKELNHELFTALEVQKAALFLVLGLIVLVSTFNVSSTLVVLVRDRMRAIGVLGALGLDTRQVRRIFLIYGLTLGLLGTGLGVTLGCLISWILTRFELIRFSPEVAAIYFIRSVPFRPTWPDVVAVVLFALGVTLLACWFPARRAARILPAQALRYE